jgi:hypothetical protein
LKEIEPERGYVVYTPLDQDLTMRVSGASVTPVQPGQLKYTLRGPDKPNHLGYPYAEPHPVAVFFQSIRDKLVVVQDHDGNFYIPEFNVNTIGDLQPGKGYEVTVKEDVVFEFPILFKLGDVNNDGLIDNTDADIILDHDVGFEVDPISRERINIGCGDVNKDGATNSTDALIIQSHATGLPTPFPVGVEACPVGSRHGFKI